MLGGPLMAVWPRRVFLMVFLHVHSAPSTHDLHYPCLLFMANAPLHRPTISVIWQFLRMSQSCRRQWVSLQARTGRGIWRALGYLYTTALIPPRPTHAPYRLIRQAIVQQALRPWRSDGDEG